MERSRLTADVTLPREPKQERSRRKQERLLTAATTLFTDPGFEHVTADDIAAHAGYGTGTFYNYFANKTQVFLMVAGQHDPAIAPTLEPVLAAMGTAASLHDVAQAIVRQIVEQRQKVPWLRRTWLRLALTDPEVDAVQRRLDAEWEERVAGIVTGVVEAGLADMPPAGPAAVATVIRVLVDAVADEVVLAGTISAEDAAGTVADLLTALLHNRAPEA